MLLITDPILHEKMMEELSAKLGFRHENSTPYYPQANGQVEAINKVLKTILRQIVGDHKSNWHYVLFSALWAYCNYVKIATGFTPFQLVYGLEAVLPIQCQIPSLQLAVELLPYTSVEEEIFLYLNNLIGLEEMLPWIMRHIRNSSRRSMINPFNLVSSMRVA